MPNLTTTSPPRFKLSLTRVLKAGPVRDLGLLDSACARPHSSAFGTNAYATLVEKAAALLHSLARNHALVDGIKRLAWLATRTACEVGRLEPGARLRSMCLALPVRYSRVVVMGSRVQAIAVDHDGTLTDTDVPDVEVLAGA